MVFEPATQRGVELIGFLWQYEDGQTVIPFVGLLGFIKRRPRIVDPRLGQGDHAEGLGDLVAAADDVAHLLGELGLVGTVGEQLIVARVGH